MTRKTEYSDFNLTFGLQTVDKVTVDSLFKI